MVMLDVLLKSGADVGLIINFEHGIRGEASVGDSAFVAAHAEKLGIKCEVVRLDTPTYAESAGLGLEEAARKLRYGYFYRLLDSGAVDVVATAHHVDDNAETVLMRIFRGTGIRGLKGITERKGFIHPLSDMTREEIMHYAADNGIPYRTDESNFDTVYTRNYIRNKIVPVISERFPGFEKRIMRLSMSAREADDLIDSLKTQCSAEPGGAVSLPIEAFGAHPAVVKKSVSDAIRALGIFQDVQKKNMEAVIGLAASQPGRRICMQSGIEAVRESGKIVFAPAMRSAEDFSYAFDLDGSYAANGRVYTFSPTEAIVPRLTFDADKIPKGAVVRRRGEKDRFRRFGGGDKTLGDYFTDIKYPVRLRGSVPVVAEGNRVYMVLGVEVSDEVKVDGNTSRIYKVNIGEERNE